MKKRVLFALFFVFINLSAFSQTNPDISGFNQSIFDYHFSRADREILPEHWLSQAKSGISMAVNAWEIFSIELYSDPLLFADAKTKLIEWSEAELEKRYFDWLCSRFFSESVENSIKQFSQDMSKIQRVYTYNLDENGNVIFENNVPSIKRPSQDNNDFLNDLNNWRFNASENIDSGLSNLNSLLAQFYPELLTYITDSNEQIFKSKFFDNISNTINKIKTEFENTVAREERILINRRTGDVWSLRKRSEDESVKNVVQNLIKETEEFCNNGIIQLNKQIEAASADTGNLEIFGDEWLALYKQEFENGLKIWEEAEKRFFIRRLEWEQNSMANYYNGEEAWLQAYIQLEEEHQKWELKIKELFDSGESIFKNASDNLEKAILSAKREFEINSQIRSEAGKTKLKSLMDIFSLCISGISLSQENLKLSLRQYGIGEDKFDDFSSSEFEEWLYDELQNVLLTENNNRSDKLQMLNNITDFHGSYKSYLIKAGEIKDNFISEYTELFDNYYLNDVIADYLNSEDFFLDEYQLALIKAKTIVNYWEKQVKIAQAVTEYAEEIHSGRITEAEGIKAWEAAKKEYEEEIIRYNNELEKLGLINNDIISQQDILNNLTYQIKEIEETLNDLNKEYSILISSDIENRTGYLITEFKSKYKKLLVIYEQLLNTETNNIYNKYIDAAFQLSLSQNSDTASQILELLISGDDDKDYVSLDFLVNEINQIKIISSVDELPQDAGDFGFSKDDQRYIILNYFINEKNSSIDNAIEEGSDPLKIEKQYNDFIYLLYSAYKSEAVTNLQIRKAELALFADTPYENLRVNSDFSAVDWYLAFKDLSIEEKKSLSNINIMEYLLNDFKNSEYLLLEKRLALEISALNYMLYKDEATGWEGAFLSEFYLYNEESTYDEEIAEFILDSLLYLQDKLLNNETYDECDDIEMEYIINWFISGGTFFIGSEAFSISEINNFNFNRGLLDAYGNLYTISSFGNQVIWEQTNHELRKLFNNYNLISTNSIFPDIENICENLITGSDDFINSVTQFLFDFNQITSLLPDVFKIEINNWVEILTENIIVYAIKNNITPLHSTNEIEIELLGIQEQYVQFENFYNSIQFFDENLIAGLNQLYMNIYNSELLLILQNDIINQYNSMINEIAYNESGTNIHWRKLINKDLFPEIEEEYKDILTWFDGKVKDIKDQTSVYDNLIKDLFLYNVNFNNEFVYQNLNIAEKNYKDSYSEWQKLNVEFYYLYRELSNIGHTISYSMMDPELLHTEQIRIKTLLDEQMELFEFTKEDYMEKASDLFNTGKEYDDQYAVVKECFDIMENFRFNLEIQDAIRRWASTPYLDKDYYDLTNCNVYLERAKIALSALSDLYISDKARPYENNIYESLLDNYDKDFNRIIRINSMLNSLISEINNEKINNNKIFNLLQSSINKLGFVPVIPEDYISPEDTKEWDIKDIITINNGILCFLLDASGNIENSDNENFTLLRDYFNQDNALSDDLNNFSQFEIAVLELAERMQGYFSDQEKIEEWGLAKNYLLRTINGNNEIKFISDNIKYAEQLNSEHSLGNSKFIIDPIYPKKAISSFVNDIKPTIYNLEKRAWDRLSDDEKEDLEFYTIITMMNNNSYYNAFSQYSAFYEFIYTYNYIYGRYKIAELASRLYLYPFFFLYIEMREVDKTIAGRVEIPLDNTIEALKNYETELNNNISKMMELNFDYNASCDYIRELYGYTESNTPVSWSDIENALININNLNENDIILLKQDWLDMEKDNNKGYYSTIEALSELAQWAANKRNESLKRLNEQFNSDYQNQQNDMNVYFNTFDNFMSGNSDIETLKEDINKAFGTKSASLKTHFINSGDTLIKNIDSFYSNKYYDVIDFSMLGNELISFYSQSFMSKYNAEYYSRQIEWDIQRDDLFNKYIEWQETIAVITERGRNDWKTGIQKFESAYTNWAKKFQEEYEKIDNAWTIAYLDGLIEKENWLSKVEEMANNAASDNLLMLIGAEAERMSKLYDTRDPSISLLDDGINQARSIISELLNAPGIAGLDSAFNYINGFNSISNIQIRQGMGNGIWDAHIINAVASDMAREINSELASLETRKLAENVQNSVDNAIQGIYSNVEDSNNSFRKSMDDMFIMNGQWTKSENYYIKDIIVNSTLFDPVITERKKVLGYKDFEIEPIELKNNLENYNLNILDSYGILNIIDNITIEIENIVKEIFYRKNEKIESSFKDEKIVARYEYNIDTKSYDVYFDTVITIIDYDDRNQSPGKFGIYIGYEPAIKKVNSKISERNELFYDEGNGELGRLLSDFQFWATIDGYGTSLLSVAAWEKPMWDDRNSALEAPSLRKVIDVTNAIGAAVVSVVLAPYTGGASVFAFMALTAGINSTDDLIFNTLDYALGYKTLDEAVFDFGKASLINLTSSFASGIFGGVAGVAGEGFLAAGKGLTGMAMQTTSNAAGKLLIQTAMTGVQTISTGLVTSAIGGITYNHDDGWGYSQEAFKNGLKGTMINAFSSMTTTFTTGIFNNINTGTNFEKLNAFNSFDKQKVQKLNGLMGSLAGQGVQYALSGDFTLNLLNTSLFTNGFIDVGLLELRLGADDGHIFGIGTGGANISPDNIFKAAEGGFIWNLNNRIERHINNDENTIKDQAILRAQYGHGDKDIKKQLFDILNGKVKVIGVGNEEYAAETTSEGGRTIKLRNYQPGMDPKDQLFMAILLGHEAYRDAVVTDDNNLETQRAVLGHMQMAESMMRDGYMFRVNYDIFMDFYNFDIFNGDLDLFNGYIDNAYDSSGDYWKRKNNGSLQYDGYASLVDESGKVLLSLDDMGLRSEGQIESALLYMLNIDPNDKARVNAARQMMVNAGLQHTDNKDPDKWFWSEKEQTSSSTIYEDGEPVFVFTTTLSDLTRANMGKEIKMDDIFNLQITTLGMSGLKIAESIDRMYGSALNFIDFSIHNLKSFYALNILDTILPEQMNMIFDNIDIYNNFLINGVNTNAMVSGNVTRTSEFDETFTVPTKDKDKNITGYITEDHTGHDSAGKGISVTLPPGYWKITKIDEHRLYVQLVGTDLKLRIMHLNPADLSTLTVDTIYGGENPLSINYPDASYGAGSGAHIHIDMTRNLLYNDTQYTRQFVNPTTLLPGSRLDYHFLKVDTDNKVLSSYFFNRY